MRKTKQKRYTSLLDIDAEIFKKKRDAKRYQAEADQHETEAKGYRAMSYKSEQAGNAGECQYWKEQSDIQQKKAEHIRKKINAINGTHIPRLARTRAALQTTPMPFIKAEEGVTLEP